jgi:hypothetical protein
LAFGGGIALAPADAHAQEPKPDTKRDAEPAATETVRVDESEFALPTAVPPPPSTVNYFQYGVAFTGEFVANAGPICGGDSLACILGSGGGIAIRLGIRRSGPWYFGGAYELSKQDPSKLYRLAILQQLRFEVRHHFYTARTTQPFIAASGGLAGYGNEWSIATWGGSAFLGAGFESQIANGPLVGMMIGYRAMYLQSFDDSSGLHHEAGVAHFVSVEATLEARDRL